MPTVTAKQQARGKTASARWQARRALAIQHGTWRPYVPAATVVEHVTRLRASMSVAAIAHAAGLSERTVQNIIWPAQGRPMQQVTAPVADAILAIGRHPIDVAPDHALISAVGTIRRLRALHRIGWPGQIIGQHLGITRGNLSALCRKQGAVSAGRARQVRDLYQRLSGRPGPSATTRRRAIAACWPAPDAWIDIDDPASAPSGMRVTDVASGGVADEIAVAARVLAVLERGRRERPETIAMRRAVLVGEPLLHGLGSVPPPRRHASVGPAGADVGAADGAGDGDPVAVHDGPAGAVTARVVHGAAGAELVGVDEVTVSGADQPIRSSHDAPPPAGVDHQNTGGGYA